MISAARPGVIVALACLLALAAATSLAARNARVRQPDDDAPATATAAAVDQSATAGRRGSERRAPAASGRAPSAPSPGTSAQPVARDRSLARRRERPAPRHLLVRVRTGRSVAVRARPGGRVIGRLDARTEFGSPQVLGAVRTEGRWLGVASTARTDGRLGWVDGRSSALRPAPARVEIRADLSRRRIELRRGDEVLDRVRVSVGRPGSTTPTGRFTITDKLDGEKLSPYYGCCVLALSGTQPNLPAGWTGGDRLAIHGTNDPGSIGEASSAGCLRAGDADVRRLMRRVPLGTPVEIRS
jgi:lipoprotein-anchoring transpeptidase ErfK/SrfK